MTLPLLEQIFKEAFSKSDDSSFHARKTTSNWRMFDDVTVGNAASGHNTMCQNKTSCKSLLSLGKVVRKPNQPNFEAPKLLKNSVRRKRFACELEVHICISRCISSAYDANLCRNGLVCPRLFLTAQAGPKDWLLKSGCHWLAEWMQIVQAKAWIDVQSSEECFFSVHCCSWIPSAVSTIGSHCQCNIFTECTWQQLHAANWARSIELELVNQKSKITDKKMNTKELTVAYFLAEFHVCWWINKGWVVVLGTIFIREFWD